ncbi:unnamed protein product [Chrysoparadoxa australica]
MYMSMSEDEVDLLQLNALSTRVVQGIKLTAEHWGRIIESDGWLSSQVIDARLKQLQEMHRHNLYLPTGFFPLMCPRADHREFVVDYPRISSWTRPEKLPSGSKSIFTLNRLFIPINKGNAHWMLVIVEMKREGGAVREKPLISFYDSLESDVMEGGEGQGRAYCDAVKSYLESEAREKLGDEGEPAHPGTFRVQPRTPEAAPRQHNRSDCGILMLHYIEELSNDLPRQELSLKYLTQKEISRLRRGLILKLSADENTISSATAPP